MPHTTKTGTIRTDVYAGRVIVTQPAPGTAGKSVVEFLQASHHSIAGQTVGLQFDRTPQQINPDVFLGMSVTVQDGAGKNVKIDGVAWISAINEFYELAHAMAAPVTPVGPPAAAAKKRTK